MKLKDALLQDHAEFLLYRKTADANKLLREIATNNYIPRSITKYVLGNKFNFADSKSERFNEQLITVVIDTEKIPNIEINCAYDIHKWLYENVYKSIPPNILSPKTPWDNYLKLVTTYYFEGGPDFLIENTDDVEFTTRGLSWDEPDEAWFAAQESENNEDPTNHGPVYIPKDDPGENETAMTSGLEPMTVMRGKYLSEYIHNKSAGNLEEARSMRINFKFEEQNTKKLALDREFTLRVHSEIEQLRTYLKLILIREKEEGGDLSRNIIPKIKPAIEASLPTLDLASQEINELREKIDERLSWLSKRGEERYKTIAIFGGAAYFAQYLWEKFFSLQMATLPDWQWWMGIPSLGILFMVLVLLFWIALAVMKRILP